MTIVVNGEPIAEQLVQIEAKRLEAHPDFWREKAFARQTLFRDLPTFIIAPDKSGGVMVLLKLAVRASAVSPEPRLGG